MMKTVLTKAQFAERMNRSRSCVSGWIATGKISQEALIGAGREARIWVERAEADLAASLSPSQQSGQAEPIIIAPQTASLPVTEENRNRAAEAPMPSAHLSERERDLARRAKADADKAEHDAEAARRRLAIDEGRYVLAEDAAAAWARELSKFIGEVETFIRTTLPRNIAERHNLDWKTLSAENRQDWRALRAKISDDAKERREATEQERRSDG